MQLNTIDNLINDGVGVKGKRVIVRCDLNVPMYQGKVSDPTRILRILPTLTKLMNEGAKVIVISHFGRPDGAFKMDYSLAPIADALSLYLSEDMEREVDVKFGVDCVGKSAKNAVDHVLDGEIVLLENLRFHVEEKANDDEFAKELASFGDLYVNDAFSCSHRAHASIVGIPKYLPSACGYLLREEVENLHSVLGEPERPVAAIVGGSKISTKIDMLKTLSSKMDYLFVGGGMANTFLYAKGYEIGDSLFEKDLKKTALEIMKEASENGCEIVLPEDVIVAEDLVEKAKCSIARADNIPSNMKILDVGPMSLMNWGGILKKCKTVVWNGPLGAFEISPFDAGSISLARIIASLTINGEIKSVAGGGDVLAALAKSGLRDNLSYVSTAGGAFLEWLEGKELPGVKVLVCDVESKNSVCA